MFNPLKVSFLFCNECAACGCKIFSNADLRRKSLPTPALVKKKKTHKDFCKHGCEANKLLYKKIRNRTKKVMKSAMRKEAEKQKNL